MHLLLFQIFPYELEPPATFIDGKHIILTSVERRLKYFKQFNVQLRHHRLVEIMEQCLHDNPLCRPTAAEIEDVLTQVSAIRMIYLLVHYELHIELHVFYR